MKVCQCLHDEKVRNVAVDRVQCDEIWSFCYAKQKNVPAEMAGVQGVGDVWTWTAICADTKLVPSWLVGGRDAEWAREFITDLSLRLAKRVQLTSDGHKPYLQAVEHAFGADIDYAMLIKQYGKAPGNQPEVRYSPAECTGIKIEVVTGNPDRAHIATSYVERNNLTMRMGMRRFTRLTNAFSKKAENTAHAVAIHFMHYNFCAYPQDAPASPPRWKLD